MADALKLADMQRASLEFERQRHLANWLIESSPHMPKPSPQQQKQQQQLNKKGKFKQNPIFFLAKIGHNMNFTSNNNPPIANNVLGSNSIASTFNSQTNLPLAIVSSSGRDGHKPKLRRFNSHDTSANMFSVAEFENARLARRNELENAALLRQRQRYKLNSLSSGGDCSTGESKGSKLSNESTTEPLFAEQFLEKFSLPRVVRLSYTSNGGSSSGDQTMTSSSSADSTSTAERKKKKKSSIPSSSNGELFLLYRFMRNYKLYHVFNSKAGTNRKKGYKIPQDYPGYFSFLNDKGTQTVTVYTTIVQLVRERVYKFLSLENLSAYTESQDNFSQKTHYVKATAKAGQVYRLLAVFQDGDHKSSSSQKDFASLNSSGGGTEKERGKYAQLLGDNRQIYYVSLSAKGKFYEIEQHTAPVLQKSSSLGHPSSNSKTPKQLNRECVHRIGFIMQSEVNLPLNLKLIASMNGSGNGSSQNSVPEHITIAKVSVENFIIACPLDEQELTTALTLTKLHITPQMKFTKCVLGFDNEQRMFLNGGIQTVLKYCQFNCDNFTRIVDSDTNRVELQQMINIVEQQQQPFSSLNHITTSANSGTSSTSRSEVFRKLKLTRLFGGSDRNQNSTSGHEKEDSIIFLSKNDLENLECSQQQQQLLQRHDQDQQPMSLASGVSEKMKVFTPSKKRWFKGLRSTGNQENDSSVEEDSEKKISSIDRYQDMSRLIQERFGELDINGTNVGKANSDIGYDDTVNENPDDLVAGGLQKCLSLQHIVLKSGNSMDIRNKDKPDLVNNINLIEKDNSDEVMSESEDTLFFPIRSNAKQQSFMTQKLYSEFHVKTKQHSKSQSSIQHLLNLASPQRLNEAKCKLKASDKKRAEIVLSFEDLQSLNREEELIEGSLRTQLSILDDLPYSSVRDSIILQESEPRTPSESIYAEICSESAVGSSSQSQQTPPTQSEKRFTSIRINVPSSDSCQVLSHNPSGSRCASVVACPVEDNIYNTIK
ncbi:uncharacterized protein LOC131427427 isoform X2 [Malaya genurostris]|uniref:uncharacterized protein LOC131427427 isoform X2 n=1 Tax=Malaya genurostris TaxID=325434 RepID=UPI0026F3B511|nr:uncharacterized protein LOC131427427 isoform X2 [Malaya genurostris]